MSSYHSGAAGMCRRVLGRVAPDVSKNCGPIIFEGRCSRTARRLTMTARRPFDKSEAAHPTTRRHFPEERSTHPPTMLTSSIKPHQIQVMQPKTSHKTTLQYTSFSLYFIPKTEFPYTRQKSSTAVHSPFTHTQTKRLELRDDHKKGISHCS